MSGCTLSQLLRSPRCLYINYGLVHSDDSIGVKLYYGWMPARSKKLLEPSQPGEDPELEGRQVPFADVCASSRRLVDQKGNFALFEAEVDLSLIHI